MNTVQRILKNTAALAIANIIGMVNSIILAVLISRTLFADGLGIYSTALAFFATTSHWVDLGIANFIPREVSRDLSKTNLYMINLGFMTSTISVLIIIGIYIIVPFLGYPWVTTQTIYIVILALLPTSILYVIEAVMITHERVEFITYSALIGSIGSIIGTYLLLTNGYGIVAIGVNFTFFLYLTMLIRAYFLTRHIIKPRWELDFGFIKKIIPEIKDFTLLGVLGGFFSRETEIIILSLLVIEADVGFYTAALKLITVWYIIPRTFMDIVFPILSKSFAESRDKFVDIQNKSVKYLMLIAFPIAGGTIAIGHQIIELLYGAGFDPAAPALQILSFMPILIFLSGVLWRTLLAQDQEHLALRVLILSLVVRIITAFGLVYWLGYLGAAYALGSTYLFYVLLHIYYVRKGGTPVHFFSLTWRFAIATSIMTLCSWYMAHQIGLNMFINIPISALIYGALILLIRGLDADDIEIFQSAVQRRHSKTSA